MPQPESSINPDFHSVSILRLTRSKPFMPRIAIWSRNIVQWTGQTLHRMNSILAYQALDYLSHGPANARGGWAID